MKVTIKDVAKAAGVSPSTVSRALHDNPRISEEMRKQIKKIAQEMDFHPNQMARSLVSRRSRIIGVVFSGEGGDSLNHSFYPSVLQGLGHVAGARRYHVLLGTGTEGDSTQEAVRQLTDSGFAEGLIVLTAEDVPAAAPVAEAAPAVCGGKVILFSRVTCPNCRVAESLLTKAGVPFEKLIADENVELCKQYGIKGAPTLVITDGEAFESHYSVPEIKKYLASL